MLGVWSSILTLAVCVTGTGFTHVQGLLEAIFEAEESADAELPMSAPTVAAEVNTKTPSVLTLRTNDEAASRMLGLWMLITMGLS